MTKPLVSVRTLVYNHEKYLEKCLEGILMQHVNFKYEIVIGEDCSTDKSKAIINRYIEKHGDIIKLVTSESNIGLRANSKRVRESCTGKYSASCEGDDYWIDPLKLQKQVDFMEANPDCNVCFHNAIVLWEDLPASPEYYCREPMKPFYETKDLIESHYFFVPSAGRIVRNSSLKELPEWFYDWDYLDYTTTLIASLTGKVGYMKDVMSVYRRHRKGLILSQNRSHFEFYQDRKAFFAKFNEFTEGKYSESIRKRLYEHGPNKLVKLFRYHFLRLNIYFKFPVRSLEIILRKLIVRYGLK